MVRSTVLRSVRLILIAMALLAAGCGDGDRLPELEGLPHEYPQPDDSAQESGPQEAAPAQDEPPTPEPLSPDPDVPESGSLLSLPSDAGINTATYTIERDGTVLAEGVIAIGDEQLGGIQLGNLPPGDGYTLHLVVERDGLPPCEGSTTLAIVEGRTTDISLTLECPGMSSLP